MTFREESEAVRRGAMNYPQGVCILFAQDQLLLKPSSAVFLAVNHSLRGFGVPLPLQRNLGSGACDLAEIPLGEFDGGRRNVLLQAMQLRRSWNRHDPRLLGQKPGECDLGRRRVFTLCDAAEQIDNRMVRFPSLRRKAGDGIAEVGAVEGGVLVDFP